MRISSDSHFPHPILSAETTDYVSGKFEVELTVEEDLVSNALKLDCEVCLRQQDIENLLKEESVEIAIDVHCRDTYRTSLHALSPGRNTISFEPGLLSGRVTIRPLIFATRYIEGFYSESFDGEYDGQTFDIALGEIVAWDIEQVVHVGQKKLAPMDSIFELARNSEVPDGEFRISIESHKIQINASGSTYDHIHLQRGTATGRSILLNSVYFPSILQVLAYLKESGPSEYSDREWFHVFKAKCDFYNIDLNSSDIVKNASQLLRQPYTKIIEALGNE